MSDGIEVPRLLLDIRGGRCEVGEWDLISGDEGWDRGYNLIVRSRRWEVRGWSLGFEVRR
jgi:hypothetical protein